MRDVTAAYIESLVPITEQIELNVAGRFGKVQRLRQRLLPKASLRYQPLDNLMRHLLVQFVPRPSLASDDSESADWAGITSTAGQRHLSAATDPNRQYTTTRTSNEDLKEETADTWNGVARRPGG